MRTGGARIVSHGQRVAVVIGVHRKKPHAEGSVLGVDSAVFKVFQIDAKFIVALDREGMDLLKSCRE